LQNNVFNEGLIDYDNVIDLFYSWLFSRLHFLITKYTMNAHTQQKVLDIGCGTGFQSFLYAHCGSSVVGIDISDLMIRQAMNKCKKHLNSNSLILFPECFDFVIRYNSRINSLITQNLVRKKNSTPSFLISDLFHLPFSNEYFSHINCCGSVISLVEDNHLALEELTRVLRPGGTLFIDVESKWNMDRFWTLCDVLLKNRLGYWSSFKDAYQPFLSLRQNLSIDYPYGERENPIDIRIKLFTNNNLKKEFSSLNLRIIKRWTIHSITNLIPSPILDTNRPSTLLKNLFKMLSVIEENIPFYLPGCNAVYYLQKN
jgi:MPBQ/MSBQ methyltransferase